MFKDINSGAKCRVDLEISWSLGEKGGLKGCQCESPDLSRSQTMNGKHSLWQLVKHPDTKTLFRSIDWANISGLRGLGTKAHFNTPTDTMPTRRWLPSSRSWWFSWLECRHRTQSMGRGWWWVLFSFRTNKILWKYWTSPSFDLGAWWKASGLQNWFLRVLLIGKHECLLTKSIAVFSIFVE